MVTLQFNSKEFLSELDRIKESQYPYAVSRLLTISARNASLAVKNRMQDVFTIRKKWVLSQIKYNSANKRMFPMFSEVYSNLWLLEEHETGKPRKPRKSLLAVPQKANFGLSEQKEVPKAKRISNLLEPSYFFRKKSGKATSFFKRTKKGLQYLYAMTETIKIKPVLEFEKTVLHTAQSTAQSIFKAEFERAIQSAKR